MRGAISGRLRRNRKLHCGDRGQGVRAVPVVRIRRRTAGSSGGFHPVPDQVIDAEPVAAAIAMELIAAGAEQRAAPAQGRTSR